MAKVLFTCSTQSLGLLNNFIYGIRIYHCCWLFWRTKEGNNYRPVQMRILMTESLFCIFVMSHLCELMRRFAKIKPVLSPFVLQIRSFHVSRSDFFPLSPVSVLQNIQWSAQFSGSSRRHKGELLCREMWLFTSHFNPNPACLCRHIWEYFKLLLVAKKKAFLRLEDVENTFCFLPWAMFSHLSFDK